MACRKAARVGPVWRQELAKQPRARKVAVAALRLSAPDFVRTRTTGRKAAWLITTQAKAFSFGYQVTSGSVLNGNNKTASRTSSEHWSKEKPLKHGGKEEPEESPIPCGLNFLRFLCSSVFQKVFLDGRAKRATLISEGRPVSVRGHYSSTGSAARMYSMTESLQPSMCTHLP